MDSDEQRDWEKSGAKGTVRAHDPQGFIEHHVAPLLIDKTFAGEGRHKSFDHEKDFWNGSSSVALSSVLLTGFSLSDWFPRAPGVYWSRRGLKARASAYIHDVRTHPELGGVDGFDQDDGASEGNDCGVILSGFLAS